MKLLRLSKNPKHIWDENVDFFLDLLRKEIPFAFSRFNDGEMMGIKKVGSIVSRGHQKVDESLSEELKKSIKFKKDNYFVGIPCQECYPDMHDLAKYMVNSETMPATSMINRNYLRFIQKFPDNVKNKKITWFTNSKHDFSFLKTNMYLDIVERLNFPERNSWSKWLEALQKLKEVDSEIVLFSLGPTGRVLAQRGFEYDDKKTYIDVGSLFDPFTMNRWHAYHKGWEKGISSLKKCKICN